MVVIEQFIADKRVGTFTDLCEDDAVVNAFYAAVIDGATPKTDFRYPGGETPGHLAARLLSEAIRSMPADLDAEGCVARLTKVLHQDDVTPSNRPIASLVIYSEPRREIWMIGDCQFGYIDGENTFRTVTNTKLIDKCLSEWRRDIILRSHVEKVFKRHVVAGTLHNVHIRDVVDNLKKKVLEHADGRLRHTAIV
jgi:hypothetical protein